MTRIKSVLKPPHRAVSPTGCFITCLATALRLACHLAKYKPNTSQAASPPPQQTWALEDKLIPCKCEVAELH